jgi:hypothetical protein
MIQCIDDWWELLDAHWANILQTFIVNRADLNSVVAPDGSILDRPFAAFLENLKANRDPELVTWIQLCWGAAPDAAYIYKWPSWKEICLLCSEDWVFDPDHKEDHVHPDCIDQLKDLLIKEVERIKNDQPDET